MHTHLKPSSGPSINDRHVLDSSKPAVALCSKREVGVRGGPLNPRVKLIHDPVVSIVRVPACHNEPKKSVGKVCACVPE